MPTPDTALLAQMQALRAKKPKPDQRMDKMGEILRTLDEGSAESLQSLGRWATHPLDSLDETVQSTLQFVKEPKATISALREHLRSPENRTRMAGSMLVPDPSKLIKILRTGKLPSAARSHIIVPETLATKSEKIDLEAAKRGAPTKETGWFKGPAEMYWKERKPVHWELEDEAGIWFDDPDMAARLLRGKHGKVPEVEKRFLGLDTGGQYDPIPGDPRIAVNSLHWNRETPFRQQLILNHELQHGVADAGDVPHPFVGASYQGDMRDYFSNPGEVIARVASMRDNMSPAFRENVPFMTNYINALRRNQTVPEHHLMQESPSMLRTVLAQDPNTPQGIPPEIQKLLEGR